MLLRWAWSFSLDQGFNPLQTSGPPCHDLPSQALFDEAALDNYFAWMEKRAHGVKGGCHSEGKDSRGWQKGESKSGARDGERVWVREKKRSKAGLSLFMPQKAPKRIRNNRAWGLLSSLAIRLSWWSEWYEWQGSRPSPGFTQQGVFFPFYSFLSLFPLSGTNAAEIFPNEDNVVQGAKS